MRNRINCYMGIRPQKYLSCFYYNGELVEKKHMDTETVTYYIRCIGKKFNILLSANYKNLKLKKLEKEILKSYIVIIRTPAGNKAELIRQLALICTDNHCYAPIVFLENTDILFFPKLRFQDTYLLKSILEEQLKNVSYQIFYGGQCFSLV